MSNYVEKLIVKSISQEMEREKRGAYIAPVSPGIFNFTNSINFRNPLQTSKLFSIGLESVSTIFRTCYITQLYF